MGGGEPKEGEPILRKFLKDRGDVSMLMLIVRKISKRQRETEEG
jgi:hypothetical protein